MSAIREREKGKMRKVAEQTINVFGIIYRHSLQRQEKTYEPKILSVVHKRELLCHPDLLISFGNNQLATVLPTQKMFLLVKNVS